MYRFALFVPLALGFAAPVSGQSFDDVPAVSQVVSFRDLDLTTAAGARELDRRIQAAARFVCRTPTTSPLIPFMYARRCVDGALRDAQPRVANAVDLARRNLSRDRAIQVAAQ